MNLSDRAPLIAIARGDRGAFADLYDRLSSETWGLCSRQAAGAEAARLHQQIWLFVWMHASRLSAAEHHSRTVVISVALALLRRAGGEPDANRRDAFDAPEAPAAPAA